MSHHHQQHSLGGEEIDETAANLIRYVNQKLIVKQLTAVLKMTGMPTSGLKGTLQKRIIDRIEHHRINGDLNGLRDLKRVIYKPETFNTPSRPSAGASTSSPAPASRQQSTASPMASASSAMQGYTNGYHSGSSLNGFGTTYLSFNPSPFYEIMESLTPVTYLPVMTNNRHVVNMNLTFQPIQFDKISSRNWRCMLYCAVHEGSNYNKLDVAFPQQIEIRVNSKPVTGNLRGLKNKPGTTRPLDITEYLASWPNHRNGINITYALSQKKYAIVVNFVRKNSPQQLMEKIRNGKYISKATVLEEMRRHNGDSDIVATSTVLALKCPLSTTRIKLPARSNRCKHNQCFDTFSFLQLQEQAPTWVCPVCNTKVEFDQLVVDKYVEDILARTPSSVEQVTVDPEGNWSIPKTATPPPPNRSASYDSAEEDGDADGEDSDVNILGVTQRRPPKIETPSSRFGLATPRSRETSTALSTNSRVGVSSHAKRPASAVIDLTSTDDEDDYPRQPPSKRPQLNFPSVNPYDSFNNASYYYSRGY